MITKAVLIVALVALVGCHDATGPKYDLSKCIKQEVATPPKQMSVVTGTAVATTSVVRSAMVCNSGRDTLYAVLLTREPKRRVS